MKTGLGGEFFAGIDTASNSTFLGAGQFTAIDFPSGDQVGTQTHSVGGTDCDLLCADKFGGLIFFAFSAVLACAEIDCDKIMTRSRHTVCIL